MAPRPQMLLVGTAYYQVHWDQEAWDLFQYQTDGAHKNAVGLTHALTEEIFINPGQSLNQQVDTFLHETMHACYNVAGVALDGYDDQEEGHVSALTPWLLLVLRDNPHIVAYLLDPSEEME